MKSLCCMMRCSGTIQPECRPSGEKKHSLVLLPVAWNILKTTCRNRCLFDYCQKSWGYLSPTFLRFSRKRSESQCQNTSVACESIQQKRSCNIQSFPAWKSRNTYAFLQTAIFHRCSANVSDRGSNYTVPSGTTIPKGNYTIGDEIPAGTYKIFFSGTTTSRVRVFQDAQEASNTFTKGKKPSLTSQIQKELSLLMRETFSVLNTPLLL